MEENITIEFVKEWIDKHNLTKGSFDRIMNDLIYNSGHNYIDNPSLRYWLIDNTYKFRDMLPVKLNDNQQIVLDWLKAVYRENDIDAFSTILDLLRPTTLEDEQDSAYAALSRLKEADQFQVLAAFAEWGNKSNE